MKKKLPIVLFIVLLIFTQRNIISKPYQSQVKGGFKTCTATEYRTKTGKFDNKSGVKAYTIIFDSQGNPIELISYKKNKISQKNKITNKYNQKGLLIEMVYLDESGMPIVKLTYGYDDKMNRICDTIYNSTGDITQTASYIYDENNFLVQEIHEFSYDKDNKSRGVTNYKNDKYGNKIEETAAHSSNVDVKVSSEVNLENNENKSEVQSTESAPETDKITYEYKYDENGNIIRSTRHGIAGTKLIYEYKYDTFGNVIEQISLDENTKPALKTVFEYIK